ncbi:MAG: hypothetical protein PHQ89_04555 [Bacilli bacterium]|nr:hypothetical protein [Bacilli bacterium]
MELQEFKYKDNNGIEKQATVVSSFAVGNNKYLLYTNNDLKNIEDEKQDINITISGVVEDNDKINLIKLDDNNRNVALNIVRTIGDPSAEINSTEDVINKTQIPNLRLIDFSTLFKNEIVELEPIVMRAPLRNINAMLKVNDMVASMEPKTIEVVNQDDELPKELEPLNVELLDDAKNETIEEEKHIDEEVSTVENTNIPEPTLRDDIITDEADENTIVSADINGVQMPEVNLNNADEEVSTVENVDIPEPTLREDIITDEADENINLLDKLGADFNNNVAAVSEQSKRVNSEMINQAMEKVTAEFSKVFTEMSQRNQDDIAQIAKYNEEYIAGINKSIIESSDKEMKEMKKQFQVLVDKYKDQEQKLNNEKQRADDAENKNDELNKTLAEQSEEIANIKSELTEEKIANRSHVETIQNREETIARQENQIQEKDEEFKKLQDVNSQLKTNIVELKNEVINNQEIHNQEISKKDEKILELEQQHESDNNTINTQTNIINSKSEEIRELTDELTASTQREFAIKNALGMVSGPLQNNQTEEQQYTK